jgi:hypothetical protein
LYSVLDIWFAFNARTFIIEDDYDDNCDYINCKEILIVLIYQKNHLSIGLNLTSENAVDR